MGQYSLERFLNIRSASSPSVSPDGTRVAFLTNITGIPQVWVMHKGGVWPEQLTFFPERTERPTYSPVASELVFEADEGGNERWQLFLLARASGEPRRLTDDAEAVHEFGAWSPDGARIAYSSNARDPKFFDVYVRDMLSGEVRLVYAQDGSNFAWEFSPDGRSILVARVNHSFDQDLLVVDRESGDARLLTPHEGAVAFLEPHFSRDGRCVYVLTDSDREFFALARLDLARLIWTVVWEEPWDVEHFLPSPDGRRAALVVNEDGVSRLKVLRLRDRKVIASPALPDGVVSPPRAGSPGFDCAWYPDGRRFAFTFDSPSRPTDIWVLDVRTGRMDQLTHSSLAAIPVETFALPERVSYPTFDGRRISSFRYRPGSGDRAPVIVWVHGGPESQFIANFIPIIQYLVHRGYEVFAPNVRGSTGYGKAYHHLDDIDRRMDAVADLKHAADWLRTQRDVDPGRIAVMGGSYGGFMVLASLTEYPDAWSAGVDIVGIANFVTFLEKTGPWRRKWREAEYGSLDKDRALLERISPIHKADRIRTPLFVIHGKNDPRVPLEETEQMVEALKQQGGVVDFLVFPDEGHGLVKIPNRVKGYTAAVNFLSRHMAG